MAISETSGELSTVVTSGPFYLSTEAQSAVEDSAESVGSGTGELISYSSLGATATALVEATSGGGEIIGIFIPFKDVTPYSRVERHAEHIYRTLHRESSGAEFPTIVCRSEAEVDALKILLGEAGKESLMDNLCILERLIGEEGTCH